MKKTGDVGFNAEIEISESGRRYVILRYGRIFIAKLIEEMYTDGVFNALAAAYAAKFLSRPTVPVQISSAETAVESRDRDLTQRQREGRGATSVEGHTFTRKEEEEETTEIPRRADMMLPILELLAHGPMKHRDIVDCVAEIYDLSVEDRTRVVNSSLPIFEREVWGAKHKLKESGLVDYPSRGESPGPTSITALGRKYLKANS